MHPWERGQDARAPRDDKRALIICNQEPWSFSRF